MTRKKDKSIEEHLRGEIRKLKKQVKSLTQQLKHYTKKDHLYEETQLEEPEAEVYQEYQEPCPECAKGKLDELVIAGRLLKRCNICTYRSKAVKL